MEAKILATYIIGLVSIPMIALGVVGHFLSFLVFSRRKFQHNSISIYCRALAISDSFILYVLVYSIFFNIYYIDISEQSDLLCKINYYINVGLSPISIWILVAFSIDKMLHVLDRAKNIPIIKKRSFQLAVVIAIGLFHALLYSFIPILIKVETESNTTNGSSTSDFLCSLRHIDNYRYILLLYIIEGCLTPSFIMMITTFITVKRLYESRNNLEKLTHPTSSQMKERKARDLKFALNSIVLSLLAVVLQTPVVFSLMFSLTNAIDNFLFVSTFLFFFYLNFSVTFMVHFTFNSIFRGEFLLMIRIKKTSIWNRHTNAELITLKPNTKIAPIIHVIS
jgi:hypothetical protein